MGGRRDLLGAFVFGVLIDRIGGGPSINLLAPPVFALVGWNLLEYVWLLVRPLVLHGRVAGPLRALLIRLTAVRGTGENSPADDATAARRTVLVALLREWPRVCRISRRRRPRSV